MARDDLFAGLRFHGKLHVAEHEIHLGAASETPVGEAGVDLLVGQVGGEFVEHPILERLAVELAARRQCAALRQPVDDADVREIELGRRDEAALRTLAVGRQPTAEQGVFEDLEVALGGVAGDAAVGGEIGKVDDLAVGQGGGGQKAGEGGQVAHQSLGGDFLPKVVGDVGVEPLPRPSDLDHARQIAVVEHLREVEGVAELGGDEAMQFEAQGAPAEQIRRAVAHLAGTRAAQRELHAAVLDQPMRLVEQSGDLLHLVDDDLVARRRPVEDDFLAQQFRVVRIAAKFVGLEQIQPTRLRITLLEERGFARLARSPKEERVLAGCWQRQLSMEHELQKSMQI